jgi:hypothetical protein
MPVSLSTPGPNPSTCSPVRTAIVTSGCRSTFQCASVILSKTMPRASHAVPPGTASANSSTRADPSALCCGSFLSSRNARRSVIPEIRYVLGSCHGCAAALRIREPCSGEDSWSVPKLVLDDARSVRSRAHQPRTAANSSRFRQSSSSWSVRCRRILASIFQILRGINSLK